MFHVGNDVVPFDLHIVIAIVSTLHVVEAKGMNELMLDSGKSEASLLNVIELQIELLFARDLSYFTPATGWCALERFQ